MSLLQDLDSQGCLVDDGPFHKFRDDFRGENSFTFPPAPPQTSLNRSLPLESPSLSRTPAHTFAEPARPLPLPPSLFTPRLDRSRIQLFLLLQFRSKYSDGSCAQVPSNVDPNHWIKRGVALFLALYDK